jgi:hypothetical protein
MGDCGKTKQKLRLLWNNTRESGKLVKTGHLSMTFTKVARETAVKFLEKLLVLISFVLSL